MLFLRILALFYSRGELSNGGQLANILLVVDQTPFVARVIQHFWRELGRYWHFDGHCGFPHVEWVL